MTISKTYDPIPIEEKWYEIWEQNKLFHSEPNEKEPYTIVIPPPNVTGVLHMGHVLNNTIQDVLVRKARMSGFNACWVPGTDHASIATEAKVVKKLKEEGVNKWDITREEFLAHAHAWKDKFGGSIFQQLRKLGVSCDWDRTRFTMEPKLNEAVIDVFVQLYEKGLIYQGFRMTNWDPSALTVVSDEEVYHKEIQSQLFHVRYQIQDSDEFVTIATTRPETILGDTAICLHPDDERYHHLEGKKALVPLLNRAIPFIFDDYVDMEFGTGALKVTPAHDTNDCEIGKRHNLESIDILTDDGKLSENAQMFVGEDRFVARKSIVKALKEKDHLVEIEMINNKVGYSERTNVVIEPRLTKQWFLKMKEIAAPALEVVLNNEIQFHPKKFVNTYSHWMNNIRDWCISRQLWWGQRIPVWYLANGEFVVAINETEALKKAQEKMNDASLKLQDLKQDEDVVDTWFSSWLWPISVFDGFKSEAEVSYYYPTSSLVTGPDIIFFWVARMIMAGLEFRNEIPFKDVYFTGIVRDKQGRKMSKSLGNSPEPIALIQEYGADGVRVGILLCSPAGGDLLYDNSLCEQGKKFTNKVWNGLRLVKGWTADENAEHKEEIVDWFDHQLKAVIASTNKSYQDFRISEVLNTLYKFVWNDFFNSYLEWIKPEKDKGLHLDTLNITISFFESVLKLLHPLMPFITEECYKLIQDRPEKDMIIIADYPKEEEFNVKVIQKGELIQDLITNIKKLKNQHQLKSTDEVGLAIYSKDQSMYKGFNTTIQKQCKLSSVEFVNEPIEGAISFLLGTEQYYLISDNVLNADEEKERLTEELVYYKGFLSSVEKKLSNERFVSSAPKVVVDKEITKKNDALVKISKIEEAIGKL